MRVNTADDLLKMFYKAMGLSSYWYSSALELDKALLRAGYKISNFFHDYKTPSTKEALEKESNKMWLFSLPQYNISKMKKILNENIEISDSFKIELEQLEKRATGEIIKLTEEIKRQNPELKDIKFWMENYNNNNILDEAREFKKIIKEKFGIDIGLIRLTKKQIKDLIKDL